MRKQLFVLALGMLGAVGGAHANLIINGSFESDPTKVIADGVYKDYGSWIRLKPGTTYLTGWTVGAFGTSTGPLGVDWHYGTPTEGLPRAAQDGTRMIDLNIDGSGGQGPGQGTISQTFATVMGASYTLSFYLAAPRSTQQGGTLDPRTVIVDITGVPTQTFIAAASDPANQTWEAETFSFTAQQAFTTLAFSPLANTGTNGFWGAFLDNVSVVETNKVSAPTTMSLLGLALLGLGCVRRGRRS